MIFELSYRADQEARIIADGHYNRQKKGAAQFVPPGRCLVLKAKSETGRALWITSWPFAEYVKHRWGGAWVCSAFRNERGDDDGERVDGAGMSSELIREALAATRWRWPDIPMVWAWKITRRHDRSDIERIAICMITFVDREKTKTKRDPGRCFRKAGFVEVGETAGGLVALGLPIDALPAAAAPAGTQTSFLEASA